VLHYGRVPRFDETTWDLRVCGATDDGREHRWSWADLARLPRTDVVADLHCVTGFSLVGGTWSGVATATLTALVPPAAAVRHVMVWGEYGYSANMPLSDFTAADALLATSRDGEALTLEHGFPLRLVVPQLYGWKGPKWVRAVEYLVEDRRGFWEARGYHNRGQVWREQRYGYQEDETDGPPAGGPS
jgi:DMSO/TMAO reductase YedYZ molybdopterin-dependent catalytic subunit